MNCSKVVACVRGCSKVLLTVSASEEQSQINGFVRSFDVGVNQGTLIKMGYLSIQTMVHKQLLYLYRGATQG
jgi:hypothetical protein